MKRIPVASVLLESFFFFIFFFLLSSDSEHEMDQHVGCDAASPHLGVNKQGNGPGAPEIQAARCICVFTDNEAASVSGCYRFSLCINLHILSRF